MFETLVWRVTKVATNSVGIGQCSKHWYGVSQSRYYRCDETCRPPHLEFDVSGKVKIPGQGMQAAE
jgi:hypothetical protein